MYWVEYVECTLPFGVASLSLRFTFILIFRAIFVYVQIKLDCDLKVRECCWKRISLYQILDRVKETHFSNYIFHPLSEPAAMASFKCFLKWATPATNLSANVAVSFGSIVYTSRTCVSFKCQMSRQLIYGLHFALSSKEQRFFHSVALSHDLKFASVESFSWEIHSIHTLRMPCRIK